MEKEDGILFATTLFNMQMFSKSKHTKKGQDTVISLGDVSI